jgi:hypothetical protein
MSQEEGFNLEEDLDPQDWESMQRLGHQMIDDMFDYLKEVRSRPVWRHASGR